ncbi:MAG: hypothetical protein U9R19_12130, partial [Bacteroidota bacterium]|nr:hypothetical protein [Bacteroidota bacterium]
MQNKICKLLFSLFIVFAFSGSIHSQDHFLNKANKLYDIQHYSKAIGFYKQYLGSVHSIADMAKLANCYRLTNQSVEAERLYQVIVKSNEAMPIHYFFYAKTLMSNQKYAEAKEWFVEYYKSSPKDKYARDYIKACNDVELLLYDDSINYKIFNLNINSPYSDFGAVFYKNGIVFSSARNGNSKTKRRFGWTGEPYLDLYYSYEGYEDKFREAISFSDRINSRYHEGPVSFT